MASGGRVIGLCGVINGAVLTAKVSDALVKR
jgi:hypothetical protein